jgi:hypothetical protein
MIQHLPLYPGCFVFLIAAGLWADRDIITKKATGKAAGYYDESQKAGKDSGDYQQI